jgi:hypothetical protein
MNEFAMQRMPTKLETQVASEVTALLKEIPVGADFTVEPSASLCYSLELFLPQLLARKFPEWERESLDGIFVANARKTSPQGVQFAGTCILISDQTVTPLLVDLVVAPSSNSLTAFRVCLGEQGEGRLGISGPDCGSREAEQLLATVTRRLCDIRWVYTIVSGPG